MRLLIAPLTVSAFVLLTGPAVAGDPPPVKGFASAKQVEALEKRIVELEAKLTAKPSCAYGAVCPCSATATAAPVAGASLHISPDGTINALHPDGVYRPVPGVPRQTPAYLPSYSGSGGSCPGGRCPLPR